MERITVALIEQSLCNQQNFPTISTVGGITEVAYSGVGSLSFALKDVPYPDIYDAYERQGAYNIKMLDGALIQLLYRFRGEGLISHRLAFFPSPYLDQYQNEPDLYAGDDVFAEVVSRSIVAFPVRFDFSADDSIYVDVHHPRSHLTLGEYANCRIPVSAPLTPLIFIDFILRGFYNTVHRRCSASLPSETRGFAKCISEAESALAHISIASL